MSCFHRLSAQAPDSWEAVQSGVGEVRLTDANQSFEEQQRAVQWRLLLGPEADNYSQLLLHELPACLPPVRLPCCAPQQTVSCSETFASMLKAISNGKAKEAEAKALCSRQLVILPV